MISGTVISLTPPGLALSQRLCKQLSTLQPLHRPSPFATEVQARFIAGERLIFITAMGIAVRTLAPVLRNKHEDPPVLVIDEAGRYVVPLLSAHEGGANQWGQTIAATLGAQLIITTAGEYTTAVYAAGLGCVRGCPCLALEELLQQCLAEAGIRPVQLSALATIDIKHDEEGLNELAQRWNMDLRCYEPEQMNTVTAQLSTTSPVVYQHTGVYGVAEAAALLAASELTDQPAELIIAKRKNKYATCAIARAYRIERHAESGDYE